MVGRENCLVHRNEAGITLVSYTMKFSEKGEAHVLMEKWERSVLDINTSRARLQMLLLKTVAP